MKRLFVNDEQLDLKEGERIGYTKQVNSLKDLASRQTNFTKTFRVPMTAKNKGILKGLGIPGSNSDIPYRQNTSKLFVDNICIIFKGFANFQQTSDEYEIYIYDGNIGFFKRLDNIKFEDLDLSELNHTKTVQEVKDNWQNGNPYYLYLFADYNGEVTFENSGTTYFNMDYQVPAVPIKFLWERIFSTFGFTFSGSIFTDEEFLDTYLTYPKGVVSGSVSDTQFTLDFENQGLFFFPFGQDPVNWLFADMFEHTSNLTEGNIVSANKSPEFYLWKAPANGYYNVEITGTLMNKSKKGTDVFFYIGFDLEDIDYNLENTSELRNALKDEWIVAGGSGTISIDHNENYFLYAGQTITFLYDKSGDVSSDNSTLNFNATISKIEQTAIDQFEFFKGLTPKDFYKEIMWRFGLTPFPSKDEDHIEFLTYEERVNGEVLDWSDKYVRRISEKYVYDGYSKNNYFRFKYNADEEDHNDGVIRILNENLEEKTDVIKSKTYSVENQRSFIEINNTNYDFPKLKLWEKDVKEEQGQTVIEYKSQDSRFSFLRKRELNESVNIGSEQLGQFDTASKVIAALNANYSWQHIIGKRYRPILSLFNNTKIITVEVMLTESEFDAFDMKPNLYFEQEGGTFLVDKIGKRDLNSKLTQIDLIKINK